MDRNENAAVLTALALWGLIGFSIYLYPLDPSGPRDTWEELFETGEQFRESSYSTFEGVLDSAGKPIAAQRGEVLYGKFLTLEISDRINATVFLVDMSGFHMSVSSGRMDEPMAGFRMGDRVRVGGYPDYVPDVDGRKYKTLQVDSMELVEKR